MKIYILVLVVVSSWGGNKFEYSYTRFVDSPPQAAMVVATENTDGDNDSIKSATLFEYVPERDVFKRVKLPKVEIY